MVPESENSIPIDLKTSDIPVTVILGNKFTKQLSLISKRKTSVQDSEGKLQCRLDKKTYQRRAI